MHPFPRPQSAPGILFRCVLVVWIIAAPAGVCLAQLSSFSQNQVMTAGQDQGVRWVSHAAMVDPAPFVPGPSTVAIPAVAPDANNSVKNNEIRSAILADATEPQPIKLASLEQVLLHGGYSLEIGGYVKADLIHDFDAIGSTDSFNPSTIPTDGRLGQNTRMHARQSRLNLRFRPDANSQDVELFIEGDFFGSGNAFRLRHGYIRVGGLLAGQTWSTFMDETILPSTLDFESPRSIMLDRRAQFRWTTEIHPGLTTAFALEDPRPIFDLDVAPAGEIERLAPDLVGRIRLERDWGHLQTTAMARVLRFREATGGTDDIPGWGVNFTGRFHLHAYDSAIFQVAYGEGLASYRQSVDASVDPMGQLEAIPVLGWVAGYELDWTDRLSSTLVYSAGELTNTSVQLPMAGQAGEYVAANLVFESQPGLSYGVEYLYGTRKDKSGAQGEANRIQFSIRYNLP